MQRRSTTAHLIHHTINRALESLDLTFRPGHDLYEGVVLASFTRTHLELWLSRRRFEVKPGRTTTHGGPQPANSQTKTLHTFFVKSPRATAVVTSAILRTWFVIERHIQLTCLPEPQNIESSCV